MSPHLFHYRTKDAISESSSRAGRYATLAAQLARFPAARFTFDYRMGRGWLSDRYFVRSAATLAFDGRQPIVTMQVFAKQHGVLAGVAEVVRMLQTQLAERGAFGRRYGFEDLTVDTLLEGDCISPWETVMLIRGPYRAFAHLESAYLGVLARRSLVASNVRRATQAANGKPVTFMAARHDDWRCQVGDGYAAQIGGAQNVSSDANGHWSGARGVGTMPHALIACYDGDTVAATLAFARYVRARDPGVAVVSLVDYDNDVVTTSLAVARAMTERFGPRSLAAVRVDTGENLIDHALAGREADFPGEKLSGVSAPLVRALRAALDTEGFNAVGIIVSGGFTPARIRRFEAEGIPVTGYGIGSSLLGHNRGPEADGLLTGFDFTADVVCVGSGLQSKVGRRFTDNPRLVRLSPALPCEVIS